MPLITPESLMTLEAYAKARKDFRANVIAHKKARTVHVGDHVTLIFEDELTMRYQVQEMLRIERIFEEEGIRGELDAYNPLVPDGSNLKATMMIEYEDVEERRVALAKLKDVEDHVRMQVRGHPDVVAIADEDLDRETDEKTSSVHFLRFEFTRPMVEALRGGAPLALRIDHPAYRAAIDPLPEPTRAALLKDFA
jgi:hypothetical protein